jgi:NADPH:quinone reductase
VEILKIGGVVTGYATGKPEPPIPFWGLCIKDITVRFLGGDGFPEEANQAAAADLTETLVADNLLYPIAGRYALEQIADAHEAAEQAGATGRIVIDL